MKYRQKKYLNASFLKDKVEIEKDKFIRFIDLKEEQITLNILNKLWSKPKTETKAMQIGTDIHSYLLEGADNEWTKKLKDLKKIVDLYKGEREIELYKQLEGINCKSKIDILSYGEIYDIKTTSNINDVKSQIEAYRYDLQMAFYELMAGVNNSTLIFITKKAKRNNLLIYPMPDLFLQKEQILNFLTINKETLKEFFTGA